jgi:DNA methylase
MSHTIYTADALETLRTLESNSFDGCFCDPPYGIGLLSKEWDRGVPSSTVWAEALRVLKPGASLLAFGSTRTVHRLTAAIEDGGFEIRDLLVWLHSQGFPKGQSISKALTKAGNPSVAEQFTGYSTTLKPSMELVVLATKPGQTFTHSATNFGVAGLNIDGSRVGSRWPSNVILDDTFSNHTWSRFFYCPKANGTQRDAGLDNFEAHERRTLGCGLTGISGDRSGNGGNTKPLEMGNNKVKNTHTCVKPLALTRYLANLILPPPRETPRHLLVPFSGSGSEMIGALQAGWDDVVGIEQEPEYVSISEARIKYWTPALAA